MASSRDMFWRNTKEICGEKKKHTLIVFHIFELFGYFKCLCLWMYVFIQMTLLLSGNICGVHSNKHILILFFVVSPSYLLDDLTC